MDYTVSLDGNKEIAASKSNRSRLAVERDKKREGLADLRPGQQITGTVVSVDDQVTLDFDGHKVTTSKGVMKNAVPGEKKTFEVIKASNSEIELRLMGENVKTLHQTIKATTVQEKDWETVLSKKEQAARQADKEKATQEALTKLEEISTKFTEQDYKDLEKEGFLAETLPVSGLYEAINRVKSAHSQADQPGALKVGVAGSVNITEEEIIARLKEENLPVTKQNTDRIQKALILGDTIGNIDDKTMKYLIAQDAPPTIENIYKAFYSGSTKHQEKQTKLTDKEWDELEGQVKEVIREAGYKVSSENMSDARWLLENKLPLTETTFNYKKELNEIKENSDADVVLERILVGMKSGTAPKDITMTAQTVPATRNTIEKLNSIRDEAVTYSVQNKLELSIKSLATVQEQLTSGRIEVNQEEVAVLKTEVEMEPVDTDAVNDEAPGMDRGYEELKAKRQLEELRLKMTLEAAGRLEKKGIHIETQRLEKVVEELRRLEDHYYNMLLSEAEVDSTPEALQTLRTTTQSVEQLKQLPVAVLGVTLTDRVTQTIPELLTSGSKLISDYAKAGTAYEALSTVPNAEYGDSIRKAFVNMDSLLSELNIENTQANQRAVRILGYNQMEITGESIDQVKAYDKDVTTLIQNLHPAVTVRMIKEGMNPLSIPITELNATIDRMKEEQGITSEDRFSNYLHKLEKENGITSQERKAYIGVYRLLYNVEKSDGAALGAVIKANQEVTLSHLLTAVQTGRRGRLSAAIDDEFGMLNELNRNKESIAEQLNGFSEHSEVTGEDSARKDSQEEQVKYLNRIVKQMTEELSPERLSKLQQAEMSAAVSQATLITGTPTTASDAGLWEVIKNVPIEKLLEQLLETTQEMDHSAELHAQKVQQIRELCSSSEQSLRFLNDYQMTSSPLNIMIANQILSNASSPIVRLLKQQNENSSENSENKLKELDEISDTLIDKYSMNETYLSLEAQAKEALTRACSQETLDNSKLEELRNTSQQMTFLRQMASREFYQIPIETERGITNMNLTILRGSGTIGRVSVSVWSEELGDIKAEFSLKDQKLKGFIACDNRDGLARLQAKAAEIEKAAKESNINLKQLDYGISGKDKETYSYQNLQDLGQGSGEKNNTERALYRLAKAFVQTVQLAESSEEIA